MIDVPQGRSLPVLASPRQVAHPAPGISLTSARSVPIGSRVGRLVVATLLCFAVIVAGLWYWRTNGGVVPSATTFRQSESTIGLDERSREQYARLEEIRSRVALSGNDLRGLEKALVELDARRAEIAARDRSESPLPTTLDEIVTARSHRVAASQGTDAAVHGSLRIEHLSSDTGIPPEEIRRILGRQGEPR